MLAPLLVALATTTPLPADVSQALHAVKADPEPTELTRDTHYLSSNEWRLETFEPALAGHTGTLIGVGADQNYFFAGWSGATLLVLVDFDQWVVDLHALYAVAFAAADTPEAFVAFWSRESRAVSEARIRQSVASPKRAQALVQLYRFCRTRIVVRLEKMRALMQERRVASFLTDTAQYQHVAGLSRDGRIIALRGDLTRRGALQRTAEALERVGQPVSVVYLSNAEQYFWYSPIFKANMAALPVRDDALLLRTRPTGPDYTYCVQSMADFRAQLAQRNVRTVRDLAPRRLLKYAQARFDVPTSPPMNRPQKQSL